MTLFFCLHTLVCLVGPSDIESLSAIRLIPCGEASPYTYISLLPPHVMRLVGPSGLEPPTSCLSGTRSNHLSYEPVFSTSCSEEWKVKSEELLLKFELVQISSFSLLTSFSAWFAVVEMMGFEPMTPCLQGRCSPSWATPPYFMGLCCFSLKDPSKLNNESTLKCT